MAIDPISEVFGFPVNNAGEIVAKAGSNDTVIVGQLNPNMIPVDVATGALIIAGLGGAQATISGTYRVGQVLTAAPSPGYTFTAGVWKRDGVAISGATSLQYTQVLADLNKVISFTPTNPVYAAIGGVTGSAEATPITVPGAPTIGSLVAGNSKATANWTAPASNGGAAITGYKVTASNGQIVTAAANATSIDVPGTNGNAFTVVVQALNSIGYGPASATSNSATPVAAGEVATLRQVADRSFFPTDVATQTKALFSSVHTAMDDLTALDIGYALFTTQDETTTDIGNVEMSLVVEFPVASGTQVTLTTSATGAPGGVVRTGLQPLGFTIPKGSRFKIKGAFNCTGARFPYCKMGSGRTYGSTYELFAQQSTTNVLTKPYTDSAATWNARVNDFGTNVQAQYAVMPTFILGMSTCKSVFIMGDSRSAGGSQDFVNDETLQAGAACRFLNGKIAYINASMNGDKAIQWASGEHGTKRKNTALQYCTGFMNAMGTNDYPAASDANALIALDAQIKTNVAGTAVNPYYGVTVPPTTTDSTNRYYIESAQTGNVFSPARRSLNSYRMGQVGQMYTKVFDQAATFEGVALDKWAVASTARAQNVTTVAGSEVITGTFTPADDGLFCSIIGADAGADFLFYLKYINATTCHALGGTGAIKPVTTAGTFNTYFGFNYNTYDGIHETVGGGKRMAALGLTAMVV
jgi:hypothetical protein